MELTHISLFAGIGGIDIAAEWAGFRTILFVEIDPFCQKVLNKHWPDVPIIGDIKDATKERIMAYAKGGKPGEQEARNGGQDTGRGSAEKSMAYTPCEGLEGEISKSQLSESEQFTRCYRGSEEGSLARNTKGDRGEKVKGVSQGEDSDTRGVCRTDERGARIATQSPVTLVTGGFPCQPVSVAGKRRGKDDDRWLWPEMFRVISEVRSTWVVAENVTGLLHLGEPIGNARVESKILTRTEREDYFNKVYTRQERMLVRTVLGNLEGEGYETLCFLIPACGVDAPHRRDRIFIVAHTEQPGTGGGCGKTSNKGRGAGEDGGEGLRQGNRATCPGGTDPTSEDVAIPLDNRGGTPRCPENRKGEADNEGGEGWSQPRVSGCGKDVADTEFGAKGSTHRKRSDSRGANRKQDNRNSLGDDIGNGSQDVPNPQGEGLEGANAKGTAQTRGCP